MKWIGQQIYDFVSRFRNDVYLEDISTGTIASGGNLGLDSNNKIVKADTESGELTITNAGDNRVTTSTGGTGLNAEANFLFDGNDITLGADNDTETKIQKLAHSDNHAGQISILGANATAGQTDKRGGRLALYTGLSTGNAQNGGIDFYTALTQGSTGTSLSSYQSNPMASFYSTTNSSVLDIYEVAGSTTNDRFRINVEAAGVTTLSTLDASGGVAGSLTLDVDGLINIDADRNGDISFQDDGTTYAKFNNVGSTSNLFLYEAAGASSNDFFKIATNTKGNTTISTVDAAGSDADLTLDIDGDIELNADGGTIVFKDDTATLATIDTNGINFLDNTGAGVRFEGATDDAHNTVLLATDPTGARICMLPDTSGTIQLQGTNAGKQLQTYFQSFGDDLGTAKHYLPFKDVNEQTTIYQEEAAQIAPADGRIVSVTIRSSTLEGSGNRTIGIHTIGPNTSQFSSSSWTEEETETVAYDAGDDNHVHHFAFSNDKHFESGELFVVSIQDDADLSSSFRYTYVTTIIEWDYSTWLGSTSAEFDSAP